MLSENTIISDGQSTCKEVPNNGAFMDQGEKETTVAINKGRKEEKGR